MHISAGAGEAVVLDGRALPVIGTARIYVCGITPYDVTHVGHAATFVWADVVSSIMRLLDVPANVCRNVTDVDDVLTRAAASRDRDYAEFAATQEHLFERDMAALRVRPPTHAPRARRYINHVIGLASALLHAGRAYERGGEVFFRGYPAIPGGRPAGSEQHGELTGGGHAAEPYDVAVWRRSGPEDPTWPSPWGPGRPGWHAECAAIAASVLGSSVDLVIGGADLAFPHHAYQAALVEAATGVRPFHRGLLSIGTVRVNGEKMAKSTGNLVLVGDLLRDHPAAAIRMLLLNRDWREPWDFDEAALRPAGERVDRLYAAAGRGTDAATATAAVRAALLNELDVPTALDIAEEAGGQAARLVLHTLALE